MIAAEPSPGFAYHTMSVDQEPGARLATRHLLEPGHREVVHLAGPLDWIDARARVVDGRAELAAAGVTAGSRSPATGAGTAGTRSAGAWCGARGGAERGV
jgi:DNA-binding LacI/PurR family transcriptional regulator